MPVVRYSEICKDFLSWPKLSGVAGSKRMSSESSALFSVCFKFGGE